LDEKKKEECFIHNSCFVCEICHQNLSNSVYYSPNTHDEDDRNLRFQCKKCHETSPNICSVCFLSNFIDNLIRDIICRIVLSLRMI
jgi:hypothetical protein